MTDYMTSELFHGFLDELVTFFDQIRHESAGVLSSTECTVIDEEMFSRLVKDAEEIIKMTEAFQKIDFRNIYEVKPAWQQFAKASHIAAHLSSYMFENLDNASSSHKEQLEQLADKIHSKNVLLITRTSSFGWSLVSGVMRSDSPFAEERRSLRERIKNPQESILHSRIYEKEARRLGNVIKELETEGVA